MARHSLIIHMIHLFGIVALLSFGLPAWAAIYAEITNHGETPDQVLSITPFGWSTMDLYLWSSEPGVGVELPTSPADALLLCEDFGADFGVMTRFETAIGDSGIITTDGSVVSITSYGIMEIPEPSSLILLGLGSITLCWRRRV